MDNAHGYVCLGELRKPEINLEVYDIKPKFSSRSFFRWISRKALFITSVPFYWFILFRYVVNWYEFNFFAFVVCASFVMSFFGSGWGLLNGLVK